MKKKLFLFSDLQKNVKDAALRPVMALQKGVRSKKNKGGTFLCSKSNIQKKEKSSLKGGLPSWCYYEEIEQSRSSSRCFNYSTTLTISYLVIHA